MTGHTEIDVSRKGLRATGAVAWAVSIGIAVCISLYGWGTIVGTGTELKAFAKDNEIDHNSIRTDVERNRERLKDMDAKLDLIIQMLRERK